jgi:hypothetical protein
MLFVRFAMLVFGFGIFCSDLGYQAYLSVVTFKSAVEFSVPCHQRRTHLTTISSSDLEGQRDPCSKQNWKKFEGL